MFERTEMGSNSQDVPNSLKFAKNSYLLPSKLFIGRERYGRAWCVSAPSSKWTVTPLACFEGQYAKHNWCEVSNPIPKSGPSAKAWSPKRSYQWPKTGRGKPWQRKPFVNIWLYKLVYKLLCYEVRAVGSHRQAFCTIGHSLFFHFRFPWYLCPIQEDTWEYPKSDGAKCKYLTMPDFLLFWGQNCILWSQET